MIMSSASQHGSRGSRRAFSMFPEGGHARRRRRTLKRLRNLNVAKVMRYGSERARKWGELYRTPHPSTAKTPVFIVGCNRSGTNMVCEAIGRSPHGWDYRERDFSIAFKGYYLRSSWIIEQLIRHTPAPVISFGSILDSQFTPDLLSRHVGAKAIWVYRRYEDVANSCVRMQWGPELKDFARWVARGELERLGARGKRVGPDTVRLFHDVFNEDLTDEDAACLYWYMRNKLYFDTSLHVDPRVLLVQYEHAVLHKEEAFRRIFTFLGFPFDSVVVDHVLAGSVGKHSRPTIHHAIAEACDGLKAELDSCFTRSYDLSVGAERLSGVA